MERLGDLPKLQLLDVSENLLGPTPGAAPGKIGSLGRSLGSLGVWSQGVFIKVYLRTRGTRDISRRSEALHMIGNCSELRAIFVAGNPFVEIAAARTLASCRGPRGPGAWALWLPGRSPSIPVPAAGSGPLTAVHRRRGQQRLSSEKCLLALISCTEAVGKARPGVELSAAPEAFELPHEVLTLPRKPGGNSPLISACCFRIHLFAHTTEESVMQWLPGLKISGET